MKFCPKCKIEKESSEFFKNKARRDGLRCWCKECCREDCNKYRRTEKGKEVRRKYRQTNSGKAACQRTNQRHDQKYRQLNPEKIKARSAVSHAIRDGKLIRPSHCESCSKKRFAEAHHKDYSKPLIVNWLCKECHKKWDVFFWEELKRKIKFLFSEQNIL